MLNNKEKFIYLLPQNMKIINSDFIIFERYLKQYPY